MTDLSEAETSIKKRDRERTRKTMIKPIFGKVFEYNLMSNIHLKLYNFSELPEQIEERKNFKQKFTGYYRDKAKETKEEDEIQKLREERVPDAETEIVEEIISKFIFETDSKHTDQVDLSLALKALPARVDEKNCYRVELFNFGGLQKAIISFKNSDQHQLFKFYDNRNKSRLRKLQTRAQEVLDQTSKLVKETDALQVTLKKIDKTGSLFKKLVEDQNNLTLTEDDMKSMVKDIVQQRIG